MSDQNYVDDEKGGKVSYENCYFFNFISPDFNQKNDGGFIFIF